MGSPKWLLFLQFSILTHLLGLTTAKDPWLSYGTCGDRGYYTENSPYRSNLELVLSSLPKTHNGYGFFTLSAGKGDESDSANAIAMCRGDVTATRCVSCVTNATKKLRQYCPNQKEATGWFNSCLLSYSNATLLDTIDRSHTAFKQGKNGTVANWAQFSRSLEDLFRRLREEAAKGGSFRKYAAGNSTGPGSVGTIYGTMQCNPELSQIQCDKCLLEATMDLVALNSGKIGGRSFYRYSCTIRYETYCFFNATWYPPSRKHRRPAPNSGKKGWIWSIIGVESLAILLLCYLVRGRLKVTAKAKKIRKMFLGEGQGTNSPAPSVKYNNRSRNNTKETKMNHELRLFSFESMSVATNNFSITNKLGEGGFGSVYKGKLLDGQEVAVKRLSRSSKQGVKEFENEIRLIAKLQHTNLVRLLGCCIENEEKVLVYEYMPNNSLDFFLFDPTKKELLRWEKRFAIIEGIAQGLLYLHKYSRLRVIHRDLKASNILLDDCLNPKISDFGMAKIFGIDESESNTSRVVGTRGYMSPEYLIDGVVSTKTDVFSFGVLLLEIVSSKMNIGSHDVEHPLNLAGLAWELWKEGRALELMDPVLGDTCSLNEVMRCIHIGLLCVQGHASDRPSMTDVVSMLTNENVLLPNPKRPAFFIERHEIELAKKNKSGNGSMSSLSISNSETR